MKPVLFRDHVFLDGYDSPIAIAEDTAVMETLLCQVNEMMFQGTGATRIVPVLGDKKPRNNGVSGIVLAAGGHFTCHTFSQRGIFFADAASIFDLNPDYVKDLLDEMLRPQRLISCTKDTGAVGFGKHLVLYIPSQTVRESNRLISAIVSAIHMTNLCGRMQCLNRGNISILQPITESHVSIHNVGPNAVLDVFSCKYFHTEDVMQVLHQRGITWSQISTVTEVTRGIDMEDKTL